MAEWKKVVVSGSAISQLQNDSGYLKSGDSSVVLSGSFEGDGSNLTGITADTLGNSLTDGNGISTFSFDGSGAASVAVQADGSTLTVGSGGVKVSDAGITATQLNASVAGDGLSGGAGTALSVNTDTTTITTSGDSLTLAGTTFSSSVDSRIDAAQSQATANSASIAALDTDFASDAELSALSSSAATARGVVASDAASATSTLSGSAATARASVASDAASATSTLSGSAAIARASVASTAASATAGLSGSAAVARAAIASDVSTNAGDISTNTSNISTNASSITSLSGSAHSQRVAIESGLDSKITTEKGRIDAILSASVADTDTFAEIVTLINSVDTENDTAFAGYVTSSNANQQSIADSVTSLSGSAHTARVAIASDVSTNASNLSTVSSSLDSRLDTLEGAGTTAALSASAHTARGVVASDAASATSTLSGSAHTQRVAIESGLTSDINGLSGSAHTARVAIASDVSSNASDISTIGTEQSVQDGRLSSLESFTASLDDSFATDAELSAVSGAFATTIGALDSTYATDASVSSLSSSVDSRLDTLEADTSVSALSSSAATARGVVASDAASANTTLSSSIATTTDALDSRVDTLEGASHSHSNKSNLDAINQDLGTSDDVTFNDVVVSGDLTVSGTTTTLNTTNLLVEDKFILLNSGSADPDEGGLIIDEGAGSGHAFIYDKGDTRWGFNASVASNASTANATAHAAAIVDMQNVAHSDSAEYQKNGNIKIDSGDIFIYC